MLGSRKFAGRRIKRARVAAGYKSQKAFADAIGVSENSVAHAETGSVRIGDTVFGAIEAGLRWPEDCISQYLETGDESLLPSRTATPTPAADSEDEYPAELVDSAERKIWDIEELTEEQRWRQIESLRADRAVARRVLQLREESTRSEQSRLRMDGDGAAHG